MLFWNSLAFSIIQQMLAVSSLVPLPFLNPAWIYGSSQFTYFLLHFSSSLLFLPQKCIEIYHLPKSSLGCPSLIWGICHFFWPPIHLEKARGFQKNIYFCFIDYAKAFDCVDHNKLWKIFQEMGIPDHLTCLLRNLYAGQEATVRTGHGTTDWF